MNFAKRIANARASKGGNYFKHGKGQVAVKSFHRTRDGEDNECYVLESVVISSTPTRTDELPNAPGTTVSSVFAVGKHGNVAWGNVKAALLAVARVQNPSPEELEALASKFIEDCIGSGDKPVDPAKFPARGILLDYETRDKKAKKSGIDLVLVNYSPVKQTDAQISTMRKVIDGADAED